VGAFIFWLLLKLNFSHQSHFNGFILPNDLEKGIFVVQKQKETWKKKKTPPLWATCIKSL
jgi:hypothetical protein